MLSFAITAGCGTTKARPFPQAYRCEKPELRGPTWADVAILSVEQSAAIEVCNIRNGVDVFDNASSARPEDLWLPSPPQCGHAGVQVRHDQEPIGIIVKAVSMPQGAAKTICGEDRIGCAVPHGDHKYSIYYEDYPYWVKMHEICHARYESTTHTLAYLASREKTPLAIQNKGY